MKQLNEIIKTAERTLFLDRDGVINVRIPDDYVKNIAEFQYVDGALEALKILSVNFKKIIIVTNQQGIGKGLLTEKDVNTVHDHMIAEIANAGGRIDKVFVSPDLRDSRSFTRKPAVGMGIAARKLFPEIKFRKSIMVGDTFSDMLFGHRLNMVTVLISEDKKEVMKSAEITNFRFDSLLQFAQFFESKIMTVS